MTAFKIYWKNTSKNKILIKHSACAGNNYEAIQSPQKNFQNHVGFWILWKQCTSTITLWHNPKPNKTSENAQEFRFSANTVLLWVATTKLLKGAFFLLAAAWVDPGRNALQSAEQWCKGRYGRMHQVVKCQFMTKTCKKAVWSNTQKQKVKQETIHKECQDSRRGLRWCPKDNPYAREEAPT